MNKHVGIVACSAEGAALCYRTICSEGSAQLGAHEHPEISLHSSSLAQYVRHLDAGDLDGVGELMLASACKLERAGADFLICPDNTIHQAFHLIEDRSPLPWLNIAQVVANRAAESGIRRVGLMGTHWLVRSLVYDEALDSVGVAAIRPDPEDIDEMGRIIMEELVAGKIVPKSTQRLLHIIAQLELCGCDAVVLGCTELPLVLNDANSALPTLDSTRLLARAALAKASLST